MTANGFLAKWGLFGRRLGAGFQHGWESCNGLYSFQRGYPCALWQLLHTATVGMTDENAGTEMGNLIAFVSEFFECRDCRDHFVTMSNTVKVTDAATTGGPPTIFRTRKAAVLWLWRAHNAVSARILDQEASEGANPFKSDQLHMKRLFPTVEQCPKCRRPIVGDEAVESFGARDGQDFHWCDLRFVGQV